MSALSPKPQVSCNNSPYEKGECGELCIHDNEGDDDPNTKIPDGKDCPANSNDVESGDGINIPGGVGGDHYKNFDNTDSCGNKLSFWCQNKSMKIMIENPCKGKSGMIGECVWKGGQNYYTIWTADDCEKGKKILTVYLHWNIDPNPLVIKGVNYWRYYYYKYSFCDGAGTGQYLGTVK